MLALSLCLDLSQLPLHQVLPWILLALHNSEWTTKLFLASADIISGHHCEMKSHIYHKYICENVDDTWR